MERKLVKQGAATLMISLPAKWTKKYSLDKGDSVDIREEKSSLVINRKSEGKKKITLSLNQEYKKGIRHLLTHLYRKGYDEINLENIDGNTLKLVKDITRDFLLGFEITDKHGNSCKVENLSEPTDQKYEVIFKRMLFNLGEMFAIIEQDFSSKTYKSLGEIADLRNQGDRFALFCRRSISKGKYDGNPVIGWEILTFITHTSHLIHYLYEYASKNKIVSSSDLISLLQELRSQNTLLSEAYQKKDISMVQEVLSRREDFLFRKSIELIEDSKGKNVVISSYVRELFREMQIGASPILSDILENREDLKS